MGEETSKLEMWYLVGRGGGGGLQHRYCADTVLVKMLLYFLSCNVSSAISNMLSARLSASNTLSARSSASNRSQC